MYLFLALLLFVYYMNHFINWLYFATHYFNLFASATIRKNVLKYKNNRNKSYWFLISIVVWKLNSILSVYRFCRMRNEDFCFEY